MAPHHRAFFGHQDSPSASNARPTRTPPLPAIPSPSEGVQSEGSTTSKGKGRMLFSLDDDEVADGAASTAEGAASGSRSGVGSTGVAESRAAPLQRVEATGEYSQSSASIDQHLEPPAQPRTLPPNEQVCVLRPSEPSLPAASDPRIPSSGYTHSSPHQPPAPVVAPPIQSNTDRFAATNPSPLGHRSLRRQNSMPSAPLRRARASSTSPARRLPPSPGPSSSGQLDRDHHWLSEDEATGSAPGGGARARPRRNTHRRHEGREGGPGSDDEDAEGQALPIGGKERPDLSTFGSTTHRSHPIHHRPSGLVSQPDEYIHPSLSPDPPLSYIIPLLIPLLTCASCERLYIEPTTLPCGHSLCLGCHAPVAQRAEDVLKPIVSLPTGGVPPTESQFARNPSTPLPLNSLMARTPSAGTRVSSFLQRTRSASSEATTLPPMQERRNRPLVIGAATVRTRVRCPHESCKAAKERPGPMVEPKVDVGLHKVMDLLRSTLPSIDGEVERAYIEEEGDEVEEGSGDDDFLEFEGIPAEIEHSGAQKIERSSSGSSAGGGEDPVFGGDDSKRVHRTHVWSASKRTKRPSSAAKTTFAQRLQFDLASPTTPKSSTFLADLLSELECQICVQLLHHPVTSPCGHTFCQTCLARAYDHSDKCPLCRADFPSFAYFRSQPVNTTLHSLILTLFPDLAAERLVQHKAEAGDRMNTPLFICTLAWPNLPTYIHIFEPRYRLMIRRALDSDRMFGMVLPSRTPGEINEYGTMLYIQSCNMIEDGRSIIECVGTYRFRVVERGTMDGYTVGRIERVDDIDPEEENELEQRALQTNFTPSRGGTSSRPLELSTDQLMNTCLEFIKTLRAGSAPWVIQRLNNTIGPMPTAPADFSFWMAEVMPVDEQVKVALLQIRSPRERLRLIVFWIEQFRSSWWFSRGCNIM